MGGSFGFIYPICSAIHRILKLTNIKKDSSPNSAPGQRQMDIHPTAMPITSSGIRVEALTERYFRGALDVYNQFVGAGRKRLCCLIPLTLFPTSMLDFQITFTTENASSASAVAVRESDDKVVGFIHMTDKSNDRDFFSRLMHPLKDGECYIESMCVLPEVRGRGIGTRLLEFCEARARERSAWCITLGVVANNPAKRLYQRFGFVDLKRDALSSCGSSMTLFCIFGCPHWRIGGSIMEKNLVETA
jgi:ribosomal protein S18 acetylase RimI-like enzyme